MAKLGAARTNRDAARRDFGRRLYDAMIRKGWTQAELSRRSGVGPDSITNYLKYKSLPTDQLLQKLADALGCETDDLLPVSYRAGPAVDPNPEFDVQSIPGKPGRRWLTINREVTDGQLARVLEALRDETREAG